MKRFVPPVLLVLSLFAAAGCSPRYFMIRFANTGTTDIDIIGVYLAPAGGAYGDNLLPVTALHTGEYFILEKLDRRSEYDVKVVFDAWDPDTQANVELEKKNNEPAPDRMNCVAWTAGYNKDDNGMISWDIGYSTGCDNEDGYMPVGE